MRHSFHIPSAPLGELVERLWLVSGGDAPRQERILASGTVELVINLRDDRVTIDRTPRDQRPRSLSGAVVSGPYSGAFLIDARQHAWMMGAHFMPGGAFVVLGLPGAELTDRHVDVAAIWGDSAARSLREQLVSAPTDAARFARLERALTARLRGASLHPAVLLALERFTVGGSGASVQDVVREAGLSHRRFLTVFRTAVGLAPKQYCRIRRVRYLHGLAQRTGRIDWAQLAQECGFFDQSHLAAEFNGLVGVTPTAYELDLRRSRDVLDGHVTVT
jgi:AraC-like DNA-binding protein